MIKNIFCTRQKLCLLMSIFVCVQFVPIFTETALPFTGIIKSVPTGIKFIKELAHIGETKGSKYVMEALERGAKGLSGAARTKYIQDNLLKVLVAQKRISRTQADEWMRNLGNVRGFEKALSKMAGISDYKSVGHGFELETANALHRAGYKIVEIGKTFKDGIKHGVTDIDLIATKGSKTFVFELKNYKPKNLDLLNPPKDIRPIDVIRNDMETLKAYKTENPNTIAVFIFKNKPPNSTSIKVINAYGEKNEVKVLYGEPSAIVQNLDLM